MLETRCQLPGAPVPACDHLETPGRHQAGEAALAAGPPLGPPAPEGAAGRQAVPWAEALRLFQHNIKVFLVKKSRSYYTLKTKPQSSLAVT